MSGSQWRAFTPAPASRRFRTPARSPDFAALISSRFWARPPNIVLISVGSYIRHPVVETSAEAEALNAKWPFVAAETAGEALALARKYNPAAKPDEVQRSRGAL